MNSVSSILTHLDEALGEGSDTTEIGQIMRSVQRTLAGVEELPLMIGKLLSDILAEIAPILSNVNALLAQLNDPDGLIHTVLDTDREVYTGLVEILGSVSGMLENLDRTVAFIPGQLPQIAGLITELRMTLRTAEDALTAVINNPLLRGGVQERPEHRPTGPRNIRF
jgi:ABC-type transporter Mla subunit MlaD